MSDLNRYKGEEDAIFAAQDEIDQAEEYARSERLGRGMAIIFNEAKKLGFDENTSTAITVDLIGRVQAHPDYE